MALVDVADEFFVALRLSPSGRVRVLLSDVTAAEEWDLARQALDLVEPERVEPPEPVDPEEVWPVGDLAIFRDLGLDEEPPAPVVRLHDADAADAAEAAERLAPRGTRVPS